MSGLDLTTTRSYAPSFWECPHLRLYHTITLAIFNQGPGQALDFNWNHRTNLQKYIQRHWDLLHSNHISIIPIEALEIVTVEDPKARNIKQKSLFATKTSYVIETWRNNLQKSLAHHFSYEKPLTYKVVLGSTKLIIAYSALSRIWNIGIHIRHANHQNVTAYSGREYLSKNKLLAVECWVTA